MHRDQPRGRLMGPELEIDVPVAAGLAPSHSPAYELPSRREGPPRAGRPTPKCTRTEVPAKPYKGKRRAEPRRSSAPPDVFLSGSSSSATRRTSAPVPTTNSTQALSATEAAAAAVGATPQSPRMSISNGCNHGTSSRLKGQNCVSCSSSAYSAAAASSGRGHERATPIRRSAGVVGSGSGGEGGGRTALAGSAVPAIAITAASPTARGTALPPAYNRAPRRAAAAAAAARLSSTRDLGVDGSSDDEREDIGRGSFNGGTSANVFSAARLGGGGAASGREGWVHGSRRRISLEDVWAALGAEYFQDSLVVKVRTQKYPGST